MEGWVGPSAPLHILEDTEMPFSHQNMNPIPLISQYRDYNITTCVQVRHRPTAAKQKNVTLRPGRIKQERERRIPLNRRLGGNQSRSGRLCTRRKKKLATIIQN